MSIIEDVLSPDSANLWEAIPKYSNDVEAWEFQETFKNAHDLNVVILSRLWCSDSKNFMIDPQIIQDKAWS